MAFLNISTPESGLQYLPSSFRLYQNYPIAFDKKTCIGFDVPVSSNVKVAVYDLYGRELEILINDTLLPGNYEINWNAESFSSGVYLYKMVADNFADTKKLFILKS
jgi:hypothetical protein